MSSHLKVKYEEDLDYLKCHIFRLSQKKWRLTKEKCLDIFIKKKLFKYIEANYEFMHMQGLGRSVLDLEYILEM